MYIQNGTEHTNYSTDYMKNLGFDAEQIESIRAMRDYDTEQAALLQQKILKTKRANDVDNIVVTVDNMQFDGDETAQTRMARAIVALNAANQTTTSWKLHNNTLAQVTANQLAQALAAAGEAQTQIWVNYG